MFIQEYTVTSINGEPAWKLDASSGWIPYQSVLPWKLSNKSGVHYVGLVVGDENMNVSWYSHTSFDFANLDLPDTSTDEAGLVPYQVFYQAGVDVSIALAPVYGNADLYVWFPGKLDHPADRTSLNPGTAVDQINFTTPDPGVYIILVHALEPVKYNLSIAPAGGPNWQISAVSNNGVEQVDDAVGAFPVEPIFSKIGLNPLGVANIGGFYFTRLPIVR
jgi:hypothetical protein